MKTSRIASALALAVLASALPAWAADHLQCFAIKDGAPKAQYSADLFPTDDTFPRASGCVVTVPAKQLCIDVDKTNVVPAPPGAPAGAPAQQYLCYKVKCPKAQPTTTLTDQFGTHPVEIKSTKFLCAPASVVLPTTTSTTTPTSTTTTTVPSCTDDQQNGGETGPDCGGPCPPCDPGSGCNVGVDCTSLVCSGGTCAAPLCNDGVQNGTETEVDCGGSCPACVTYAWVTTAFGTCSVTCGGGIQTRTVTCTNTTTGAPAADSSCSAAGPKPLTSQSCNAQACSTYAWVVGPFTACSVTCGGGIQTRTVTCQDTTTGTPMADSFCSAAGAKPSTQIICNTQPC